MEPHPVSFAEQRLRHRRASAVQSCLAPGPGPATLQVSTTCTTLMIRPQFDPVNAMRGGPVDSMAGLVPGEGSQHTFTIQVSQLQAGLEGRSRNCVGIAVTIIVLQCLPLYSLLLALGNPTVHYFSLDIEGAELPVLQVRSFKGGERKYWNFTT